jgi:glutamine amidotransferase
MLSQNALMSQSWTDRRGESNLDGWGIACYKGDEPWVKKSGAPAYRDALFRKTVDRIYTCSVIAHVRHATVGRFSIHNAHPFTTGHWSFAHNGTLYGFKLLEPRMLTEVDPDLRLQRKGQTDSELVFLWLMTRMRHLATAQNGGRPAFWDMMELLAVALRELDMRSRATDVGLDSQLNFVLTDGNRLFATCFRNDLFMQRQHGPHQCDYCGKDHIQGDAPPDFKCVTIVSEPVNDREWEALPAESVIGVDENLEVHYWPT